VIKPRLLKFKDLLKNKGKNFKCLRKCHSCGKTNYFVNNYLEFKNLRINIGFNLGTNLAKFQIKGKEKALEFYQATNIVA
jgi:fructosamine-3-kinase